MLIRTALAALCLISGATANPLWLGQTDLAGGTVHTPESQQSQELGLDPRLLSLPAEVFTLGLDVAADVPLEPAPDPRPKWIVRLEYATASKSSLGDIFTGDIDLLSNNESYCLTVGRYLKRDLWGLPLDLSLNGSVCFHPSNANQDDIFQYILWVQLQWTRFPWDEHLRTKVGLGEGLSYVEHIPYSEMVRRDGRESLHLLNYLEFSVSFNVADLLDVTCLNRIIPGARSKILNDAWLVGSIHHRSGGAGLFGDITNEDGEREGITGGDNLFVLGVAVEF